MDAIANFDRTALGTLTLRSNASTDTSSNSKLATITGKKTDTGDQKTVALTLSKSNVAGFQTDCW